MSFLRQTKKRQEHLSDYDDGHTIADMSGVEGPSLFMPRRPFRHTSSDRGSATGLESAFTPEERRLYVLGALKAGLLIAFAFIAGLGLLTAALLFIWTR